MRYPVILMALALPLLTVADRSPALMDARAAEAVAPMPQVSARYAPEQLQRLRQSLVAQIAVRDDAEGVRAATDQEAAALGAPVSSVSEAVALPGGGMALRTDASQLSLAVAEVVDDGHVRISERAPDTGAHRSTVKGGAHVR